MAAPAMNPMSVAFDKKSMMTPSLSIPSEAWNVPANNVDVKANCRNRAWSVLGFTSCRSIEPIMSDAIDTGPTARSLELPSTEYTNGGTKL